MTVGTPTQAPLRYSTHTRSILILKADNSLHDHTSANVFFERTHDCDLGSPRSPKFTPSAPQQKMKAHLFFFQYVQSQHALSLVRGRHPIITLQQVKGHKVASRRISWCAQGKTCDSWRGLELSWRPVLLLGVLGWRLAGAAVGAQLGEPERAPEECPIVSS